MSQLSLSEFADEIGEIFPVVIKEFIKKQTNELCRGKVTMPQFVVLNFLGNEGEARMTDLANFMGVSTAAMTGIVERLFRCDYVWRLPEAHDRRIIKIKLTSKGSSLVKKINHQRHQMIIDIFGKLSEAERESYLKIIMRIRDILINQTDEKN
jgi:MarR family transcriptional regulator, organic hydroperoxide resistance regulator